MQLGELVDAPASSRFRAEVTAVEAPRMHRVETRWPCARVDHSTPTAEPPEHDWETRLPPTLRLVVDDPDPDETDEAGTQRLLAAMAAVQRAAAQTRRSPWL